jgi:hypothetical protein
MPKLSDTKIRRQVARECSPPDALAEDLVDTLYDAAYARDARTVALTEGFGIHGRDRGQFSVEPVEFFGFGGSEASYCCVVVTHRGEFYASEGGIHRDSSHTRRGPSHYLKRVRD